MTEFPAELSFVANHFNGPVSNGGRLIITPYEIIFRPHKINFNLNEYHWPIQDVVKCEGGFLTNYYITFADGKKHHFSLWKKGRVTQEIEARKNALMGMR